MFDTLRALAFVVLLIGFYPIPVTLVFVAAVRLVLGWGNGRKYLALSGVLALPQAFLILFTKAGLLGAAQPPILVGATALLALIGLVFWGFAVRQGKMDRFWLEPFTMIGATAFLLFAVPSWIAH